jgi:dihydroflavonol-4-reductase
MILVTGGTGFLGRFIVDELLRNGDQVRILARNPAKAKAINGWEAVDIAEGDLLDAVAVDQALQGVERVIHAAAVVSFWKRRRPEMKEVNVRGTELLVDLCLEHGIQKLVHVSSVAALGRSTRGGVIDESAKWSKSKLNTFYGRTKYLAELEVIRGVEEGLPAVMCNPGVIIGPGDWNAGPPRIFKTVHGGLKYYNPGTAGFVTAEDVARAIVGLLKSDLVRGERHVLVSNSLDYKTFFTWVAESMQVKAPSRTVPQIIVGLAARLLNFWGNLRNKEPLITPETARISRHHSEYDGSLITRNIDFQYSDLREAILKTGRQFLEEK